MIIGQSPIIIEGMATINKITAKKVRLRSDLINEGLIGFIQYFQIGDDGNKKIELQYQVGPL